MNQDEHKENEQRLQELTPAELFEQYEAFLDKDKLHEFFHLVNKVYQAYLAKLTAGISPSSVETAFFSWLSQIMQSPGLLMELAVFPWVHAEDCQNRVGCPKGEPLNGRDIRFHSESWQEYPWRFFAENFLQAENWWQHATTQVPGLADYVKRTVSFSARQILDALSPSNFVMTNPDLFNETLRSNGQNLIRGTELAIEHMLRRYSGEPPPGAENFIPGKQVAVTPGKVVYKNHLIELLQYEPQSKTVYKEPVLIIPAWIMKYYILDLSSHNSLVNWLVKQGHTVFMISWRNPETKDRNLGMDDYYRLGAMAAIDQVSSICKPAKIHLAGYCLGGTLALITAAAMARDKDKRLKSLTLLAAQGDFTEAGELMLFITANEIFFLKNMMWEQGYLDTKQMAGAFQLLRSYDLIWSKMVQDYMHGRERGMIDLLAWNADATRMPYKMHSEYLEKLFLNNEFARGKYSVEGKRVVPKDIHLPVFAVSTEEDHVAPWHSVYKIHLMVNEPVTFVLTNGGHNAGIVSEPGHKRRYYRIHHRNEQASYLDENEWLEVAKKRKGSWWPSWQTWLVKQSSPKRVKARVLDKTFPDAPGKYVLKK